MKAIPKMNATAQRAISDKRDILGEISLYLSDNPELAWEEHKAHDKLCSYLEQEGFDVTRHYKLETAFRASYTQGKGTGRTFGLNSEYDALPDIGHGCGHNLIAVSGVAALIGMRAAMEEHDISGTVVLLGTPAEEKGSGKIDLIDLGAYKEMDACMMLHPGKVTLGRSSVSAAFALMTVEVEYFGKPAHAASMPWQGVNALDAAVQAYGGIAMLRQQLKPEDRVHAIILNGGTAVNVIPEYSKCMFEFRSLSAAGCERIKAKLEPIIYAAATATGCTVKTHWEKFCKDLHHSEGLGDAFKEAMDEMYNIPVETAYGIYVGGGSTDFGNVTYELPACHPHFGIVPELGRGQHTAEFAHLARSDVAHEETFKNATGVAAVGLRFLSNDAYAEKTRRDWEDDLAQQ